MKRSPDWSIDELADSVWDEIGTAHGFIQPQSDLNLLAGVKEKPTSELENYFGKNKDDRGSEDTFLGNEEKPYYFPFKIDKISNIHELSCCHVEDSFFSAASYPNCISNSEALSSHDPENKDSCPAGEICNYNAVSENDNMVNLKESCSYVTEKDPQTVSYANIVNDYYDKGSNENPMFFERPDNFEDINAMFRDRDLTHGKKQVERSDGTSWFPASYETHNHPEAPCTSGLSSSYSDLELINDSLGDHCTSIGLFAEFSQPSSVNQSRNQLGGNWMDNHDREMDSSVQNMGSSSISEAMKLKEFLYDEKIPSHFPYVLQETHGGFVYSDISPSNLPMNINWDFPSSQTYMTPYMSGNKLPSITNISTASQVLNGENCYQRLSSKELKSPQMTPEMGISFNRQQLLASNTRQPYQQANIYKSLTQGKNLENQSSMQHDSQELKRFSVLPESGADSFAVKENLFVTAVSSYDIPIEAAGFHQLSNVMDQLDMRTKLCMRDSFYRFASSAKKRCNSISRNRDTCTTSQITEASNRYISKSPEKGTGGSTINLVDQFIANLLFHRANIPPASSCGFSTIV